MRHRRILTATALTAAVVVSGLIAPSAAVGSTRGTEWRARSIAAFLAARSADSGSETPHYYAYMAETSGKLNGWSHSYTQAYLSKLYSLVNPDGGWGLGYAYDAFGDGSINPATTTYAVTLAGHVGPPLLAGYQAGAVPRARVQTVVDLLVQMPRVPVDDGQCVAYSTEPADGAGGMCVHNVNAGVGAFLDRAAQYGLGATGMHRLITDISVHEVHAYRPTAQWWPYQADGPDQDVDHQSYSAQSMYPLSYWVGREAVYRVMDVDWPDVHAAIAYARLTGTPGGVASWSRTSPGLPLWCEMGDRWTGRIDAYLAGPRTARQLAQIALYSARAWANCP